MDQQYINKKVCQLSDNEVYQCIEKSLLQGLRMVQAGTTAVLAQALFTAIIGMVRKFFSDFTMNDLSSAIEAGGYGLYGEFTKMNPITIQSWLNKKRLELSTDSEKKEKFENRRKEDNVIPLQNGGSVVLYGLFLNENGINISFQERLKIIESGVNCPHTSKTIKEILKNYNINFKLEKRR